MNLRLIEDYIPGIAQGACYLCRASRRDLNELPPRKELVVATGTSLDYEGEIALCESCLREAGALVGLIHRAPLDEANSARDEAIANAEAVALERDNAVTLAQAARTVDQRVVDRAARAELELELAIAERDAALTDLAAAEERLASVEAQLAELADAKPEAKTSKSKTTPPADAKPEAK